MYLALLILGVMVTFAGAAMIGYGIPINGFDVGNMLIMAGTTAFVGGLILIALAEAVKQLRRIAESGRLAARPVRAPDVFGTEAASASRAGAGPDRIPFPPKPEARGRARMASEPRLDAAPSIDTAKDTERSEPDFAHQGPEPRIMPEHEETPLSPQAEPRFASARDSDDELAKGLLATAFSRLDVSRRPARVDEPQKANEPFDSVWPAEQRKAPDTASEPVEDAEAHGSDGAAAERKEEQPEAPYAVSILKSGVIDGMAYTLYSDGSIEAQVAGESPIRFASFDALRAHVEQQRQ